MTIMQIEQLLINYKTLEDFKSFKDYGNHELQMFEDLQANIIENDNKSPFYGIYYGDKLIARMSLYHNINSDYNALLNVDDYLDLSKLEVLPQYRNRGYGRMMIHYAKSMNLPIITRPRVNSEEFWRKVGFVPFNPPQETSEKLLVWHPGQLSDHKIN